MTPIAYLHVDAREQGEHGHNDDATAKAGESAEKARQHRRHQNGAGEATDRHHGLNSTIRRLPQRTSAVITKVFSLKDTALTGCLPRQPLAILLGSHEERGQH